jgi:RNA polymerase sigma-70 factor (ECF subfamily)
VGAPDPDARLLERLRAGEEPAFAELVDRYSGPLLRLARLYVPSAAVAEEVVQETWLGVLGSLERFEGRSTLKTWLFRIALNRARTRGEREHRTVPLASLAERESVEDPAPGIERFLPADHDRWPHHWAVPPRRWEESPEHHAEAAETMLRVREAIERLSPMQRLVITLRDLHGWDGAEVCNVLELHETNQRVLLHRARSRVRADLETFFADDASP